MSKMSEGMNEIWSVETLRVPIPPGRDPFVNTPLLALGPGADGAERFWISTWNSTWFVLDSTAFGVPAPASMSQLPPETDRFHYAGKPGYFLMQCGKHLEVRDMRTQTCALLLAENFDGYAVKVQGDSVYLIYQREIEIIEGCLRDLR